MQSTPAKASRPRPALSVILPACNEAELIGRCLDAVLASEWPDGNPATGVEIVVAANGCTDDTAAIAEGRRGLIETRGWALTVLDLPDGGKLGALNAAEAEAQGDVLVYLDADVIVSPPLLSQLYGALSRGTPGYASGRVRIATARSRATRAYRRIYRKVPFITHGVPGCGLFAINREGRARWGDWPDIISDDTFARLNFAPTERIGVPARYAWPLVEGFGNLVRVRRRQNRGVDEIAQRFPELLENDDKPRLSRTRSAAIALRDPFGFAIYAGVALAVRLSSRSGNNQWLRGR